jgi:hypothetical protein
MQLWSNYRCCLWICLEELRRTMKSLRIISVLAKIWTRHIPSMSKKCYCLSQVDDERFVVLSQHTLYVPLSLNLAWFFSMSLMVYFKVKVEEMAINPLCIFHTFLGRKCMRHIYLYRFYFRFHVEILISFTSFMRNPNSVRMVHSTSFLNESGFLEVCNSWCTVPLYCHFFSKI